MLFQQVLDSGYAHDASGITNPHEHEWENRNGIYYPVKKENKPSEQDVLIENSLKEFYNMGIDRAIEFCKSQYQLYQMIDPKSPVPMVIDSIAKTLQHFKKV